MEANEHFYRLQLHAFYSFSNFDPRQNFKVGLVRSKMVCRNGETIKKIFSGSNAYKYSEKSKTQKNLLCSKISVSSFDTK